MPTVVGKGDLLANSSSWFGFPFPLMSNTYQCLFDIFDSFIGRETSDNGGIFGAICLGSGSDSEAPDCSIDIARKDSLSTVLTIYI